jgi:LPXTG-motif cell wall-anchored protein
MSMLRNTQWLSAALALCAVSLVGSSAGAQTETKKTEIKNFEVVSVEGNKVIVKGAEGSKEVTVPEDMKLTVDGKQVTVHDLKPGMHGQALVTTTTTVVPVQVTEVKNGKVMKATGNSIIVRTDQGIKMFSEGDVKERGVKIMRDGQPIALTDLHEGDNLTATIVTQRPPKVLTKREVEANMSAPAAAHAPAASQESTSASAAGARHLPKTASPLPLIGALGVGLLAAAITLTMRRRRQP